MPDIEFLAIIADGALVGFIGFRVVRDAANEPLLIAQPPLVNKLVPTLEIPLESLSKVDSRFFWSAMSRFDVFEIDGVSDGKLLLPVGLVSARNPTNNGHSAAI